MFKFNDLFRKKSKDSNPRKDFNSLEPSDAKQIFAKKEKDIPEGILHEIVDIDIASIINTINKRQLENSKLEEENYRKADKYISDGNYTKASELTQQDVTGYYTTYLKAQSEEQKNNLLRAAEIYWFNIYHNATIAPGNYDRLLILLKKLNKPELELKIAELYLRFGKPQKKESIKKRIENIQKKLRK